MDLCYWEFHWEAHFVPPAPPPTAPHHLFFIFYPPHPPPPPSTAVLPPTSCALPDWSSVPSALRVCPLKLRREGSLAPRFICYSPASKSVVRHLQSLTQSHTRSHSTVQSVCCTSLLIWPASLHFALLLSNLQSCPHCAVFPSEFA